MFSTTLLIESINCKVMIRFSPVVINFEWHHAPLEFDQFERYWTIAYNIRRTLLFLNKSGKITNAPRMICDNDGYFVPKCERKSTPVLYLSFVMSLNSFNASIHGSMTVLQMTKPSSVRYMTNYYTEFLSLIIFVPRRERKREIADVDIQQK